MPDDDQIIHAASHPRAGWDDAVRTMAEHGDDQLLDEDVLEAAEWDETEWQW